MTLEYGRDAYELAAEDAQERQERYSRPRRRLNIDCADGMCAARDCLTCFPDGDPDDDTPEHCETCHGQGEVFADDRTGDRTIPCPDCDGRETV